jgi:hypothetical protein
MIDQFHFHIMPTKTAGSIYADNHHDLSDKHRNKIDSLFADAAY